MIRALVWKDLRLAAPAIVTALLLFAASYASMFLVSRSMSTGPFPWFEATVAGTHFAQWSLVFASALLGASLIASERENGSDRFFFALPVWKGDALASKAVVALLAFECLWLLLAAVAHAAVPYAAMGARDRLPGAAGLFTLAAVSFMVMGLSWGWAARVSKPIVAAVNGIITAGIVLIVIQAALRVTSVTRSEDGLDALGVWAVAFGILGFSAGAWSYSGGSNDVAIARKRSPLGRRSAAKPLPAINPINRFRALLWKDVHLARVVLLFGLVVLVLPYLLPLTALASGSSLLEPFGRASTQALWLSTVVFAVWGGFMVSTERATATSAFLLSLPVSQRSIAASRLLLTYLPALVLFSANLAAMLVLHALTFRESPVEEPVGGFYAMTWSLLIWQENSLLFAMPTFGMPLVAFGVAWLGAAALRRPFLGIGLGVASPGLVLVVWLAFVSIVESAILPFQAAAAFYVAGVIVSLVCVLMGYRKLREAELA